MAKARSSRLQRLAGWLCSSVLVVARLTTTVSSSGGKAPGSTGAWGVLQAGQAGGDEAFAPQADGMAVAAQRSGDLLVAGSVGCGSEENDVGAEDKGLGRGTGADEVLQFVADVVGQDDA